MQNAMIAPFNARARDAKPKRKVHGARLLADFFGDISRKATAREQHVRERFLFHGRA